MSSRSASGVKRWAEGVCGGGNDDVPVCVLRGAQRLSNGDDLQVQMAVVRLRAQATDLLVSISRPPGSQQPADASAETGVSAAALLEAPDEPLLFDLLANLEIHDWGLFGDASADATGGTAETEGGDSETASGAAAA